MTEPTTGKSEKQLQLEQKAKSQRFISMGFLLLVACALAYTFYALLKPQSPKEHLEFIKSNDPLLLDSISDSIKNAELDKLEMDTVRLQRLNAFTDSTTSTQDSIAFRLISTANSAASYLEKLKPAAAKPLSVVKYVRKSSDVNDFVSALKEKGFNVVIDASSKKNEIGCNAIAYGSRVDTNEVKMVALIFMSRGMQLQRINRFSMDEPNTIQVYYSPLFSRKTPKTPKEIYEKLPR